MTATMTHVEAAKGTAVASPQCKLSPAVVQILRCPICGFQMTLQPERMDCLNAKYAHSFPVVDGVPVLLNETRSVFRISDLVERKTDIVKPVPRILTLASSLVPQISRNVAARANYKRLGKLLLARSERPRVLIVGGAIHGQGMEPILDNDSIELVQTDVYLGESTELIADAHDLPFADGSFDGVIVQAVLEHVTDPYRCVAEIWRVLGKEGLVYAETPFMQQVHLGRYDFTRFTHLGHRRLFREFDEISSGVACGPGMALAWSFEYFLLSFAKSSALRALIRGVVGLTLFWLKYFDYYLQRTAGGFDAASGFFFLGRRSATSLTDAELIKLYRGAVR